MILLEEIQKTSTPLPMLDVPLRRRALGWGAISAMTVSALIIAFWPTTLPDSYSLVEHTISESGGQGVDGAWVLHLGVMIVGAAVALIWLLGQGIWSRGASFSMAGYVAAVVLAAVIVDEPWFDAVHDTTEAFLHTAAVVISGVAFCLGVLLIGHGRNPGSAWSRRHDFLVILVIAITPILMIVAEPYDGLIQRTAVVFGFSWLYAESLRLMRDVP